MSRKDRMDIKEGRKVGRKEGRWSAERTNGGRKMEEGWKTECGRNKRRKGIKEGRHEGRKEG
jgi:hypothetical protein